MSVGETNLRWVAADGRGGVERVEDPVSSSASAVPGYHGCYWRIDLSARTIGSRTLSETQLRAVLGGSGLGVLLMLAEQGHRWSPLAAEAPLAFVFSPLVGSPLTTSAKFAVVHRSPLTDRLNDSLVSSGFALAGKRAGMDALVLVGRAAEPSVLVVDGDTVQLQPAHELWGLECADAEGRLRRRLGSSFRIAVIGPAGENLVRFATVSHDGRHAGRGGAGAVLGSKLLKAVAVRGDRHPQWADPQQVVSLARKLSEDSFGPATAKYRELGTAANLLSLNRLEALPTRNFQQSSLAGVEELSVEQLQRTRSHVRSSCAACTIGCEHLFAIRGPSDSASEGSPAMVRVEYESLYALGALCGVTDPEFVLLAAQRCDALGIDTITAGATVALAMEVVERGLWNEPGLRFGSGEQLVEAIEKIGRRDAWGDRLAEGSRRLAEEIGGDAQKLAAHVKGLELPGYDPRRLPAMAVGFATNARGADHNRSGAYEVDFSDSSAEQLLQGVLETEDRAALIDSLILCKFLRGVFPDLFASAAEMLSAITGWNVSARELRRTARRIVEAKRYWNTLCGWQPPEDTLPERLFASDSLESGSQSRTHIDRHRFGHQVRQYNMLRNWNPEGWIPDRRVQRLLSELGLSAAPDGNGEFC